MLSIKYILVILIINIILRCIPCPPFSWPQIIFFDIIFIVICIGVNKYMLLEKFNSENIKVSDNELLEKFNKNKNKCNTCIKSSDDSYDDSDDDSDDDSENDSDDESENDSDDESENDSDDESENDSDDDNYDKLGDYQIPNDLHEKHSIKKLIKKYEKLNRREKVIVKCKKKNKNTIVNEECWPYMNGKNIDCECSKDTKQNQQLTRTPSYKIKGRHYSSTKYSPAKR